MICNHLATAKYGGEKEIDGAYNIGSTEMLMLWIKFTLPGGESISRKQIKNQMLKDMTAVFSHHLSGDMPIILV